MCKLCEMKASGTETETRTSRCLCTSQVDWIQGNAAEFQQSKWEQSEALQDDQIDVEENQSLERACQDIGNTCCILECISNPIEVPSGIGSCSEDGEDDEKVEEREEEVLGYQRHFDLPLRDHSLER